MTYYYIEITGWVITDGSCAWHVDRYLFIFRDISSIRFGHNFLSSVWSKSIIFARHFLLQVWQTKMVDWVKVWDCPLGVLRRFLKSKCFIFSDLSLFSFFFCFPTISVLSPTSFSVFFPDVCCPDFAAVKQITKETCLNYF